MSSTNDSHPVHVEMPAQGSEPVVESVPSPEADAVDAATNRLRNPKVRPHKERPAKWEWNLPLLWGSLAFLILVPGLLYVIYSYQSTRVATGLWKLAETAKASDDRVSETKWLKQLAAYDSRAKDVQVRLALAVNASAKSGPEIVEARRALANGLASLDPTSQPEKVYELRSLLIQRLLELGKGWAGEAENQILMLNAKRDDPDALRWLAMSLYAQAESGEWRPRDKVEHDRDKNYWSWVSVQPVGDVIRLALDKNPESVELTVALLSAYVNRTNFFENPDFESNRRQYRAKAENVIAQLKAMEDGKAQWASYLYASKLDPISAKSSLVEMAPQALQRLKVQAALAMEAKMKDQSADGLDKSNKSPPADPYESDWDVQLVTTYASELNSQTEHEAAYAMFQDLIGLEGDLVSIPLLEASYVGAGLALWNQGKSTEAMQISREGCDRIGPLDGLLMWHALAAYSCDVDNVIEAKKSLDYLNEAIQTSSASMLNSTLVRDEIREERQRRLDAIKWHAGVLSAGVDMRDGKQNTAVVSLQNALATHLDISPDQKGYATKLLAKAYAEMEMWDLSAQTLESAIALTPEDKQLRTQTADAWKRAGRGDRAAEQLKLSDNGSFEFALAILQSTISKQRTLPPSQRDGEKIQQAIKEAEARLKKEKDSGLPPLREWLLEALTITSVEGDGTANDEEASKAREEKFIELVKKYSNVAELQSLAAVSFRVNGRADESQAALNNLKILTKDYRPLWIETNIKLALVGNELEKAKELVELTLADESIPKTELFDLATSLFSASGKLAEACDYLKRKADALNEADLFRLGSMMVEIEQQETAKAKSGAALPTDSNISSELDDVIQQLSLLEGGTGTRWRLLKANRLFNRYSLSKNSSELQESSRLQYDILTERPNWAQALALAGKIAAAQGKPEKAVGFFQRAIAEGDTQITTIFDLVRQLNGLGRFSEAEVEFERISGLTQRSGQVSELAIGIAQRNGRFDQALVLARQGTERRKLDPSAWLFLSQAAIAKASQDYGQAESLRKEAEEALNEGNRLADGRDINIWLFKLRFAVQFQGLIESRKVLEELAASPLPEKQRILLTSSGYLQIRDFEISKSILDKAIAKTPKDIELNAALAEFHRAMGDQVSLVEVLEELVRLDPRRDSFRKALAFALVTARQDDGSIPWDRIATLVRNNEEDDSDASKLFHSLLLTTRGDKTQMKVARELLRELLNSKDPEIADNAVRLSIAVEQRKWGDAITSANSRLSDESLAEIRRLFDGLTRRHEATASDLFQYADFLLRANVVEDVPELIGKLEALTVGSPFVLNLQVRLAHAKQESNKIIDIVENWLRNGKEGSKTTTAASAGKILSQLGFVEEGLRYLQRAYSKNPIELRPYVVGLTLAKKLQEATEVCISRYEKDKSPEAISLLADVAVQAAGQETLDGRVSDIIFEGLKAFPNNARVQESIGTLRLTEQRHAEAYELLKRAEALAPNSLLTLNNIAMAVTEIPGMESEGLPRITRAIEIYGRSPDLLDTLGVVQFRCGMVKEAEETLREAISRGTDPRYRLHLIQILELRKDREGIKKILKDLDVADLKKMILTVKERQLVDELTKGQGNNGS